ncbi:FtsK/SpoIIIE domain-containing protein [Microcella putealis]|uniref:FtsK/SpoIIIE domain-containing protein n=1 Tax=Microcella putealis TaxID=337005 RepID=UPI00130027C4|nr:FtsK/SpoIIIE domain-containing protein [Microcella putealis]
MTLRLPEPPPERPRPPFPVIAVIAPLVAAVVIGLIIRSPYVLVFAALSPIIAIASSIESRRTARRDSRRDSERFARECATFLEQLEQSHADESLHAFVAAHASDDALVVGAAPGPSGVLRDAPPPVTDAVGARRAQLASLAATNPRMPVTVPRAPLVIVGSGPIAERLREWCTEEIGQAEPPQRGVTTVTVSQLAHLTIETADGTRHTADAVLPFAAEYRAHRSRQAAAMPPMHCTFAELPVSNGPSLPIGRTADGPFHLDVVAEGPHIVVGGASGSGKSEFLRALSLAAARRAEHWRVLFVDFKGGATFSDLHALPTSVGLITDLDAALADRALGSLRAEIRRRETVLAASHARDIADMPSELTRLLIVVDEYAALLQNHPELTPVFADLSARGRSLGMHLVLCTQRPGGVVHDQITVNCGIRVLFRTTDGADARALLGQPVVGLDKAPRGRAVVMRDGAVHAVQTALVADADIAAVGEQTRRYLSDQADTSSPWSEPLPVSISRDDPAAVATCGSGPDDDELVWGLVDDVASQRWAPALWRPARDGMLGITGCPGSGRSTALASVAAAGRAAGWAVVKVPDNLVDAVHTLERLDSACAPDARPLVVIDGLGAMLETAPHDHAATLLARLDDAARGVRERRGAIAVDLGTASSSARWASGRVGARLALRALDADDHAAAGAPRGHHDVRLPAGRGWWHGSVVQVFSASPRALATTTAIVASPAAPHSPWMGEPVSVPVRSPLDSPGVLAVVSSRPHQVLSALASVAADRPVVALDPGRAVAPHTETGIIVGHPDDWQRAWGLFAELRRTALIVLDALDAADARALLGARIEAPPIARGEVWLVDPGQATSPRLERGRWPSLTPPEPS